MQYDYDLISKENLLFEIQQMKSRLKKNRADEEEFIN